MRGTPFPDWAGRSPQKTGPDGPISTMARHMNWVASQDRGQDVEQVEQGEVRLAAATERAEARDMAERDGFLVVEVEPPGPAMRGRLALAIESAVEGSLERRGAPPPGVGASSDLDASLSDQLFRARQIGRDGLFVCCGTLEGIANLAGTLDAEDSAVIRWWMAAATERSVRLLLDARDRFLGVYGAPTALHALIEDCDAQPESGPRAAPNAAPEVAASVAAMELSDVPPEVALTDDEPATFAEAPEPPEWMLDNTPAGAELVPPDVDALSTPPPPAEQEAMAEAPDAPPAIDLPAGHVEKSDLASAMAAIFDDAPETTEEESALPPAVEEAYAGWARGVDAPEADEPTGEVAKTQDAAVDKDASETALESATEPGAAAALPTADTPAATEADADCEAEPDPQTEAQADDVQQTEAQTDDVQQTEAQTDDVQQTEAQADDVQQTEAQADDVQQTEAQADDVQQTEAQTDDVQQTEAQADDVQQTEAQADDVHEQPTEAVSAEAAPADEAEARARNEWRSWMRELDSARGPKPLAVIERMFVSAYVPLSDAVARGVAGGEAESVLETWAESFEKSYSEAFDALRLRGKRPTMVLDVPEVAHRIGRLHGARAVQLLMVDGMRFDLGLRVQDQLKLLVGQSAALTERLLLWSALPSTTAVQLELIGRGPEGLREPIEGAESALPVARGRSAGVLRRLKTGHREVMKLDLVESRMSEPGESLAPRLDALANEVAETVANHFLKLPARTLVMLFGDHGFVTEPQSTGTSPARHGGASPEEVLVPGFAWLVGNVH